MKPGKILFYDLESSPLKAWVWGCGKQVVRHAQLDRHHSRYGIICVTYCWNDGGPVQSIDWGYEEQDTRKVIQEFDEIIKQADMTIGKNSNRFDTKMINAARMFSGLPGLPEWTESKDDLEVQMRKYFRLPSQSLDYISGQLGLGGKIKMEFNDWVNIVEKNEDGRTSFDKMITYGKKDTEDTRTIWNLLSQHFDSKWNQGVFEGVKLMCKHADCGAERVRKAGTTMVGQTLYQRYRCSTCDRYAGKCVIAAQQRQIK